MERWLLLAGSRFGRGILDGGGLRSRLELRLRQITDLVVAAAAHAICDLAHPPNPLLYISELRAARATFHAHGEH